MGKGVLFVCVENAGRSQMAEAFAKKHGLPALSAGTIPAPKVNPLVVEVMKEEGLNLEDAVPKMLTTEMIEEATLVVTMGCSVEKVCPRPLIAEMRKKLVDWQIDNPRGKSLDDVRKVRDEIETKVDKLRLDLAKHAPIWNFGQKKPGNLHPRRALPRDTGSSHQRIVSKRLGGVPP